MSARIAVVLSATAVLLTTMLPSAVAGEDIVVEMRLMHFTPETVEATTGSTVVFVNADTLNYPGISGEHRVVAENGAFDTGAVAPGARFSKTFNEPFETLFRCIVHPQLMEGTMRVSGAPVKPKATEKTVDIVEPKANDPQTWGYDPATVSVDVGGKVTWRNNGAVAHTVTAEDGSFNEQLSPGEKYTRAFPKGVALRYRCEPHPWMKGVVKVGANAKLSKEVKKDVSGPAPAPPVQPPRQGTGPSTFTVQAVEPDVAQPTSWAFQPPALTVRAGDTIVWKNVGGQEHTATADDGNFDLLLPAGASAQKTFDSPATLTYACKPHPWMKGTIKIVAAGADVSAVPPPPQPETPPGPEQSETSGEEEHETAIDPARTAFAVASSAAIVLLTVAMLLVQVWADRRRRPQTPSEPPAIEQIPAIEPERELAGV